MSGPAEPAGTVRGRRARPRIVLVLVLICTMLPLALLAAVTTRAYVNALATVEQANLRNVAHALGDAIDAEIGAVMLVARTLALSRLLDHPRDHAAFEEQAREAMALIGGTAMLFAPAPDYAIQAMSDRPSGTDLPRRVSPVTRPHLAGLRAAVYERDEAGVSDPFFSQTLQQHVVAVVVPVNRPDQARRALAVVVPPAIIQRIIDGQALPEGAFAAVTDSAGRIVAASAPPAGRGIGSPGPGWLDEDMAGRISGVLIGPDLDGEAGAIAFQRLVQVRGWTVLVGRQLRAQETAALRAMGWLALGFVPLALGMLLVLRFERDSLLRASRQETEALAQGRQEVERLHAGLPCVIFLRQVAPDGSSRLVYRGGDMEGVTGWPASALSASQSLEHLSAPEDTRVADHLRKVLAQGSATESWRLRQPDGSWRPMRTKSRRLSLRPNGSGEVVGYAVDVSAERAAEARAISAARLASLGEMAGGLAHELKQPLQVISLAAENARHSLDGTAPPDVMARLERISAQAIRAGGLVENLRRFARGGEAGAKPVRVSLDAALAGAMSLIGHALHEAQISVEAELGSPPLTVLADQVALEQVLTNLLMNARDALAQQPATAPRVVRITGEALDGRVALRIADTGGGIPAAVMERIFEPFVTTKAVEAGTGLGLSICHGIVTAMGGSIAAENGPQGAIFTVTLPRA